MVINYHRWILTGTEWNGTQYDPNSERLLDSAVVRGFSLRHDAMGMKTYYSTWEKNYVHRYIHQRPVLSEGGWVKASHGNSPMNNDGYADWADVRLGEFTDAQDAHANMMDFRYNSNITSGETYSWFNDAFYLVKRFMREGGYHLYPKTVTVPSMMTSSGHVTLSSVWANSGWGYCPTNIPQWNQKYKVAYALLQGNTVRNIFVAENSDLSTIVQNDDQSFSTQFSLTGVQPGNYTWAVGLIDKTNNNAIGLDVSVADVYKSNGWVLLNNVVVTSVSSGINSIADMKQGIPVPNQCYNLLGQRVSRDTKGLVIVNNKKLFRK